MQDEASSTFEQEIGQISGRYVNSLARVQLFAEIARIGFEHSHLACQIEPSKPLHVQLSSYINSQGEEFYDLFQFVAIRCWSAIEAFVEDVCLASIRTVDWGAPSEKLRKIKCNLNEVLAADQQQLGRLVLDKIAESTSSDMKQGVNRFESLLEPFSLHGSIPPEIRKVFISLSKYRNCIVHNDSIIDPRLATAVPEFAKCVNTRLGVTRQEAREFLFASLWYVLEVCNRVRKARGLESSSKSTDDQAKYLDWIASHSGPETAMPFAKPNLEFGKSVPAGSRVVVLGPPSDPGPRTDA